MNQFFVSISLKTSNLQERNRLALGRVSLINKAKFNYLIEYTSSISAYMTTFSG